MTKREMTTSPNAACLTLRSVSIAPFRASVVAAAVAAALAGCAVAPQPFTKDEQTEQLRVDRSLMFRDQEPVTHPLSLSDAMARAIKYNLDHRLKLMEEAVAQRQLDLSNFDLLPRLTAAA